MNWMKRLKLLENSLKHSKRKLKLSEWKNKKDSRSISKMIIEQELIIFYAYSERIIIILNS